MPIAWLLAPLRRMTSLGETESTTTALDAPRNLPTAPGSFIEVNLSIDIEGYPTWRRPIRTSFRRNGEGWTLVGLERLPETVSPEPGSRTAAR